MPIHCPIQFPSLTQPEMAALDYEVMRHAFATHQELGCLCDESVYQAHLAHLLTAAGMQAEREVPVTLSFRDFTKPLYLDLVVNRLAIYELKTVAALTPAHFAQLLNYLFLTNAARGKLINFRPASVESQFVNSVVSGEERRRFEVTAGEWHGADGFRQMIEELVADWGTGLEGSLYLQALVHCLGGEELVRRQLPMRIDGADLGNQRFYLVGEDAAFHVTTFQDELSDRQALQLRKLVAPSPLQALHWVNVARHKLTLKTISL
jgi:GxxExxY protein